MANRFPRDSRVIWKSSIFQNTVCEPPASEFPPQLIKISVRLNHTLWEKGQGICISRKLPQGFWDSNKHCYFHWYPNHSLWVELTPVKGIHASVGRGWANFLGRARA